jgi:hypothetical protein
MKAPNNEFLQIDRTFHELGLEEGADDESRMYQLLGDLRFNINGLDAPVPVELKIADKWTGPRLHERLEEQLCGDYLRDGRSSRGIFALVFRGERVGWDLPNGVRANTFEALVAALQKHWSSISEHYPGVDDIKVIGVDLTKRGSRVKRSTRKNRSTAKL